MGCISEWAASVSGDINVLACIIVLKISSLPVRKNVTFNPLFLNAFYFECYYFILFLLKSYYDTK